MRAPIALGDIIGKAENIFLVGVIPLHRHFDNNIVLLHADIDNLFMDGCLVLVQVLDKSADAAFILKQIFLVGALVEQVDTDTGIEKRQFTQTFGQDFIMKLNISENFGTRQET